MFFLVLLSGFLATCIEKTDPKLEGPELPDDNRYNPYQVRLDPVFEVHSTSTRFPVQAREIFIKTIPRGNIYLKEEGSDRGSASGTPPPSKISPVLAEWLEHEDGDKIVEIIITFNEDFRIPLLPDLGDNENRDDGNSRRAVAIAELKNKRVAIQTKLRAELEEHGSFEYIEGFWIVNSIVVRTKIDEIVELAEAQIVVYLQPVNGGEKPPSDTNNDNDAQDARERIFSDPYFNLGLTSPWIGLLDTGVRNTHQMLALPGQISYMHDCVKGGDQCDNITAPDFNPTDSTWNHGTRSAGIITGNDLLGSEYRGITNISTDSWKIYKDPPDGLNSAATLRAIQAAIGAFDRVLVGELQVNESEIGAIATAADNAYDAGVIFVSANGNTAPNPATVRSPAIAHKVVGVGAFKTDSGTQEVDQAQGPATDGRTKPDIQAPTESETASASSDTALAEHGATSGATAIAASVAMLARNWLKRGGTFDNGQTYAFLILYGQNPWPYDNIEGAGRLRMATDGWAWWGKVAVTQHLNIDIPIDITAGKQDLDVALWWPESAPQDHSNIDVYLVDPDGVELAMGVSDLSIFERTAVNGTLASGTWIIRIRGTSVLEPVQTVYWAAHVRN